MRLTSASFTEPRQLLHKVCLEKHHIIKKKKKHLRLHVPVLHCHKLQKK